MPRAHLRQTCAVEGRGAAWARRRVYVAKGGKRGGEAKPLSDAGDDGEAERVSTDAATAQASTLAGPSKPKKGRSIEQTAISSTPPKPAKAAKAAQPPKAEEPAKSENRAKREMPRRA